MDDSSERFLRVCEQLENFPLIEMRLTACECKMRVPCYFFASISAEFLFSMITTAANILDQKLQDGFQNYLLWLHYQQLCLRFYRVVSTVLI